jgi:hypothetical protein
MVLYFSMEEKSLTYNQYAWPRAILKMAAGLALSITVIGGVHAAKASTETYDYLSNSPNIEFTPQMNQEHDQLPGKISSEAWYSAESFVIAGLASLIAFRQFKKIRQQNN